MWSSPPIPGNVNYISKLSFSVRMFFFYDSRTGFRCFFLKLYFVWCCHWQIHAVRFYLVEIRNVLYYLDDCHWYLMFFRWRNLHPQLRDTFPVFVVHVSKTVALFLRALVKLIRKKYRHLVPLFDPRTHICIRLAILEPSLLLSSCFSKEHPFFPNVLLWFPSVCWISILIKCRATRSLWTTLLKMPTLQSQKKIPNLPTICTVPR